MAELDDKYQVSICSKSSTQCLFTNVPLVTPFSRMLSCAVRVALETSSHKFSVGVIFMDGLAGILS